MPAELETQVSAKDEQFRAVAQILAVGLQRFFLERRTPTTRSIPRTPEPADASNDSAESCEAKAEPRPTRSSVDALIETKASEIRRQCGLPTSDLDDLRQSIRLDLLKRQHLFDPQRASWEWFAKVVINSWAAMYLRDRKRLKRVGGQKTLPLHETSAWMIPDTAADPRDYVDRMEAIDHALMSLPECRRRMLRVVSLSGRAAAAREFDVSRRQISNMVTEARQQFEAAGLGRCDVA